MTTKQKLLCCAGFGVILCGLALASCGDRLQPTAPAAFHVINATDMRILLAKAGLKCEQPEMVGDANYRMVDEVWFNAHFPGIYRQFLGGLRQAGFQSIPKDCDDHARAASMCAQMALPSMAVGEYWFHTKEGTLHAVNVVVTTVDSKPHVIFWEPQTQKPVELTEDEIKNGCVAWRM